MNKAILVVAAHPDDEVLGCGGTVARRAAHGDSVHLAVLGEGITSRSSRAAEADRMAVRELRDDARGVAGMLGAKSLVFGNMPDNRFDQVVLLEIVKIVERWIRDVDPEVVYTHHPGDLNIDHRVAFQAVLTATRPVPGCRVKELYSFEIASSTEWAFQQFAPVFKPNVFEEITSTLDLKLQCLERYRGEVRSFPHPRSIDTVRAVAHRWGSAVGIPCAEAFELVRSVRGEAARDASGI
ncbi:MAG: hypothetical protein A3G81_20895 [Betaproteobacteria bacterium RIFCSPLOWO2_12_FULL_65_14]|nr:MAG: hypothetical protein A3G81_20895 [Betaproteobacteria bacterium RIFCSPLOWO2_12_FULL_65_14]